MKGVKDELDTTQFTIFDAVVIYAAKEWQIGMKYLYKHPQGKDYNKWYYLVRHAEVFLLSEDFNLFTELDGYCLLKQLNDNFNKWRENRKC